MIKDLGKIEILFVDNKMLWVFICLKECSMGFIFMGIICKYFLFEDNVIYDV